MRTKEPCFHLSMKHLETGLLFRDREDYIAGWNRLVVCQQKTEIIIYAFALMSNHFHLLMRGSSDTAKAFFEHYRKTTSMYMQSKYGLTEFGKSMQIGAVVPVTDPDMFRPRLPISSAIRTRPASATRSHTNGAAQSCTSTRFINPLREFRFGEYPSKSNVH